MPGRPIVENSVRHTEGGYKVIAVGKVTHSRLKSYAGGDSISHAVKRLLDESKTASKQGVLPGQERVVSEASLSAMSTKLDTKLDSMITQFSEFYAKYAVSVYKTIDSAAQGGLFSKPVMADTAKEAVAEFKSWRSRIRAVCSILKRGVVPE